MTELAQMTPPPHAGETRTASGFARLAAHPAWISLLLAAATVLAYYPVVRCQFVDLDDALYFSSNTHVQKGLTLEGLAWALSTGYGGNWHPLTWLSHMLDAQVFGPGPAGPHVVNLLLHVANTLLLFGLLRRLTGALWRSAFVAALFALHPLHVESVAWVSERKDVLSAFFFLLTLWAYACCTQKSEVRSPKSEESPKSEIREAGAGSQRPPARSTFHVSRFTLHASRFYALSLLFFALGLMSKPMLVTLPIVLLLLDYWPLRRLQLPAFQVPGFKVRLQPASIPDPPGSLPAPCPPSTTAPGSSTLSDRAREKWPFFVLTLAACVVTLGVQHAAGAVGSLTQLSVSSRIVNAVVSYSAYLGKALWPVNLCIFYPYSPPPVWQGIASAVLLACLTVLCVWQARSRPYLLAGWLWFCVMLVPVIGLVQVGSQAMADRYSYLPLIGLFIMLAWGAGEIAAGSRPWRITLTLGAALLLGACLAGTRSQAGYWQNTASLFGHALRVTTGNWLAHYTIGSVLASEGKADEAAEHYRAALKINPAYDDAHNNLGCFLAERGKLDEAKVHFEAALRRNPRNARAHRNLGNVLFKEGDIPEAVFHYSLSRELQPDDVATPEALATVLAQQPESQAALPYLRAALDLLPTAELRTQVASAWAGQRRFRSAVEGYSAAVDLTPESPELLNNLAWLRATCPEADVRDGAEAVRLAERACELTRFQRTVMVGTLAAAYAEAGRFAEAVATGQKACALAAEAGDPALAGKNQELLQLYRAGRPYRETAAPVPAPPASPRS